MPSNAPKNAVTNATVKNPVSFTSASQQANQPADFVPLHLETRTHVSIKVYPHPNSKEENKLAAQHAADMKANRGLRKICADKAFIMDGTRLLFLVTAIGAQGIVKATTGVELWSDPVLIAIISGVTVNALSAFLRVVHSLFPLSRSADQQDGKKDTTSKKN